MRYYVYLILNKVNGKTYIGQRKSKLEWNVDKYIGSGVALKCAKEKYGIENFEKFLIQYCYSKEEINKAEKFWIAEYRSRGKAEYNIADGGDGCSYWTGKKRPPLSEEHKRKISETSKGHKKPPRTSEWKIKQSETRKNKHWFTNGVEDVFTNYAPEDFVKGRHFVKHKPMADETRKKISEANTGKKLTGERLEQVRTASLGRHWFTNGIEEKFLLECPECWVFGRKKSFRKQDI